MSPKLGEDHWREFYESMDVRGDRDYYRYSMSFVNSSSGRVFGFMTLDELKKNVERFNGPVIVYTMPHAVVRVIHKSEIDPDYWKELEAEREKE